MHLLLINRRPTFEHVAAGRMDAFWQFSDVRSGLVAGALLVSEAGRTVTWRANPGAPGSRDFLGVLSPLA